MFRSSHLLEFNVGWSCSSQRGTLGVSVLSRLKKSALPHPKFNVGSRRASCDGVCTDIPQYLCKTYFGVVNTEATLSSGKSRRGARKVKKGCELWERQGQGSRRGSCKPTPDAFGDL